MSRVTRRERLLLSITIGLALLLVASTAALAVVTTKSGGAVKGVKVVTETAGTNMAVMTFTDIPGMSLSMTVPSGEKAHLLITFSASTSCIDSSGINTNCFVRVLVDGTEALPGQVLFDTAADGDSLLAREASSMQFVAGPLLAGFIRSGSRLG